VRRILLFFLITPQITVTYHCSKYNPPFNESDGTFVVPICPRGCLKPLLGTPGRIGRKGRIVKNSFLVPQRGRERHEKRRIVFAADKYDVVIRLKWQHGEVAVGVSLSSALVRFSARTKGDVVRRYQKRRAD
jgi:hypothetical protein